MGMTNTERIITLRKRGGQMVEYLTLKVSEEDWHGVADAAMDLREIDAKLGLLEELLETKAE